MAYILLWGAIGGTLRGLVGFAKYQTRYKDVPFRPLYLALTAGLSAVVGFLAAWVTQDLGITFLGLTSITPAIAFVIGYAGGDFIENLFKIITGKPNVTLPETLGIK